jgi:hypothetical protein
MREMLKKVPGLRLGWRQLRQGQRYLRRFSRLTILVGGKRYRSRAIVANLMASVETHEPWLDRIYEKVMLDRRGAFIDVGANIGQTLLKVLNTNPSAEYVGFEPQLNASAAMERFLMALLHKGGQGAPLPIDHSQAA